MSATHDDPDPRTPGPGRQALIDAAIAIVARRGLRGLTYRAVAQEAGVTHALVTHHFGSRDAFILEAVDASARSAGHAIFNDDDTLETFAENLSSFAAGKHELLMFQYEMILEAQRRPELQEATQRMYADTHASIAERLQLFGFPDDGGSLARVVLATIDGLFLQHIVSNRSDQVDESIALLREMLTTRLDRSAAS